MTKDFMNTLHQLRAMEVFPSVKRSIKPKCAMVLFKVGKSTNVLSEKHVFVINATSTSIG
jgi:hypothetical protein